MTFRAISASIFVLAALSACNGEATDNTAAAATTAAAPACIPGSATLPITGLCEAQASALLLAPPGAQPAAPDGCTWIVSEAKVLEGALLYRAAKCKGGIAKLDFVPGARIASFRMVASPYGPGSKPETIARMIGGDDPKAAIVAEARQLVEDPAKRARCKLRAADVEGWPSDALVVDEAPAPGPPADGIRAACGEFGLDQGAQTFWRVSQGVGWFFQLGQESPVVDAGSFTLVNRGADGSWVRA